MTRRIRIVLARRAERKRYRAEWKANAAAILAREAACPDFVEPHARPIHEAIAAEWASRELTDERIAAWLDSAR